MRIALSVFCVLAFVAPAFGQGAPVAPSPNPATTPGVTTPLGFQPFPTMATPPSISVQPNNVTPGSQGSPTGVMMPWMGISSPQPMMGQVIRQVWVEPQIVPIQVYLRQPEGVPEVWQTQDVQIPGYWATETTKGTIYPPRWTLENPGVGVYQWRQLPGYFQQR